MDIRLTIFISTIVILVLFPNFAASYFHLKHDNSLTPYRKKIIIGEDSLTQGFVLYDNLIPQALNTSEEPILNQSSDSRIYADKFPARIPLHLLSRKMFSWENYLSNIVFSNLKIRLLIKEYETLRKSSRAVFMNLRSHKKELIQDKKTIDGLKDEEIKRQILQVSRLCDIASPDDSENNLLAVGYRDSLTETLEEFNSTRGNVQDLNIPPLAEEDEIHGGKRTFRSDGNILIHDENRSVISLILRKSLSFLSALVKFIFRYKVDIIVYITLTIGIIRTVSFLRKRGL